MSQKDIQRFALAQDAVHRPASIHLIAAVLGAVLSRRTSTMTSRWRFMAICFGLAAWFWCSADAVAQAQPTSPQPADADHPTVAKASSSINWDMIRWVERRYKIEAISFKALDETGFDWFGSDDVMVETTDAKGWTVSNEIRGIDSGDTHNFDPAKSCIVAVRPGTVVLGVSSVCETVGEPAPLGFQVELWEQDSIGSPTGFCIEPLGPPNPGRHVGPYRAHCPNGNPFSDFIGRAQIDYPTQDLEAALPKVGDEVVESITLDACPDLAACAGFPVYTFTWRVTRLSDVRVDLRSALDEAMQISGARSELEAIRAGLRYLRAPSPRKTEPETGKLPPVR